MQERCGKGGLEMSNILVTGGTGNLGHQVVSRLLKHKHGVRIASNEPNPSIQDGSEFIYADIGSGKGISEAVAGVDAIVHLATSVKNPQLVDVEGTRKLIETARVHGSPHFMYLSIVGVDRTDFLYYKAKYDAERIVENAGLPWTIQRSTQFHNFIVWMLQSLGVDTLPEIEVPSGIRFQPIDVGEAADRLVLLVERGASGRVSEIGGPQVLTIEEATESYLRVRGRKANVRSAPLEGEMYDLFRSDGVLTPGNKTGKTTWEQFLISEYGKTNKDRAA
jgi:uncharacterized protein YbjT (DUF2867 family)